MRSTRLSIFGDFKMTRRDRDFRPSRPRRNRDFKNSVSRLFRDTDKLNTIC